MTVSRDYYYKLSSDIEKERIDAAISLINDLNAANDDTEWEYALTRLIKGLSSSRGSSRLGFSTCLTELVNIRLSENKLTLAQLIGLININNKVASSMNGKEERAVLFGKLFGLQCICNLNSGVFSKEVNQNDFKIIVDNLFDLAALKSWIREPTLFTIVTLLGSIYAKLDSSSVTYVFTKLDENQFSLTTEGLAIYLSVPVDFRTTTLKSVNFQNPTWKESDPLKQCNISLLAKVLKDVSSGDDTEEKGNNKKKGSWSPRLHFVWPLIVRELTIVTSEESVDEEVGNSKKRKKSSKEGKKKSKSNNKESQTSAADYISVAEFWKVVIDEGFFSEKASHERKYWGFEIFELLYASVSPEITDSLFTQNFMRSLINQTSDNNRLLNKVAKKTLSNITEISIQQPPKALYALQNLLTGDYGSLQFDRLTKSKTTETIVTKAKANAIIAKFFTDLLKNPTVKNQQDDKDSAFKTQKWAIDQLLHLIRGKKATIEIETDLKWLDSILKALVKVAFLKNPDVEESPIAEFAQERLNSILSDVVTIGRTDNQTWPFKTLSFLIDYSGDDVPIFEFDEELQAVKDKSLKVLKKIRNKRESSQHIDSSKLLVFELLFSMVTIQLFSGDAESVDTLQELQDYYYANKKQGEAEDDEDKQDSVYGIVEILLNFVSQKSALLKKLSMIVWENFCEKVDLGALELLFDVIKTKENKEGQRALFEGEDEFVDEDEEEDEHDHGDHEHGDEDESDEESEDSDEDSDDDDDDDEEEGDEEVSELEKKTNIALAEALNIPQHDGEVTFSSDDDDDMSDESMDDEQMMAIDGQLSKIFKQRRDALDNIQTGNKRKAEVQDARENILLFKHRILDLLEIFAKKNPNSELLVYTIEPLLTGLKLTLDKSLGVKIHKLLKNRICKSKIEINTLSKDYLFETLERIQTEVLRTSNTNDFNLSSSQCSIFISKQILALDESSADLIIDQYTDLLKKWWAKKNSRLTCSIFFDFLNWLSSKRTQN